MMSDEPDWLEELCKLMREGKIRMTFSKYCQSGIVGLDQCPCWRCERERGGRAATA